MNQPQQDRVPVLELVASSRGGGAVHVRDLARGMDRARFGVQVGMAQDGGNVQQEDFEAAGIPLHNLNIASGFSLAAVAELRGLLPTFQILHVHGARAALFGRLAVLSLRQPRPRVVYSIHGFAAPHYPPPRRQVLLTVEYALAPVTDQWVCVSLAERDALLAAGVADPARVRVIWNGIDTTRFARGGIDSQRSRPALGLPTDAYVVTTICRLFRPRDFGTLLEAFRQVLDRLPRAHLLIVGDGPLRADIEGRIVALHLESHVHLLGIRRDVPQLLGITDVLTLSSRGWEGLPLTVLEAMASSVPVVASDVGGTREALVDGETGYLFAPGDAPALAQRILTLAARPELAQEIGCRGLRRVREHFTVQRMVNETMALYEKLL